jgi:predicted ATPase
MASVSVRGFHGRDAELALIQGELERLNEGAEAVLVVEGAAGMGKSRLLSEVADVARGLGIRTGCSAADPSETTVELAALLAALFDGGEPLLAAGDLESLHAQPEQRFWVLRDL